MTRTVVGMHTEPARIIALALAVLIAAVTAWQANTSLWTEEQLAIVISGLAAVAALGTYLTTQRFGPAVIPAVVAVIEAVAMIALSFGLDTGETPLGIIAAVLAAIGGEVNRAQRSPLPVG